MQAIDPIFEGSVVRQGAGVVVRGVGSLDGGPYALTWDSRRGQKSKVNVFEASLLDINITILSGSPSLLMLPA
jgi:hypothetical protein